MTVRRTTYVSQASNIALVYKSFVLFGLTCCVTPIFWLDNLVCCFYRLLTVKSLQIVDCKRRLAIVFYELSSLVYVLKTCVWSVQMALTQLRAIFDLK